MNINHSTAAMSPVDLNVFNCPLTGIRLIEASAGTGKTWNICGLYLRLLLEKKLDVQQILVVTFTKAATAELRERIRGRIVDTLAYLKRGLCGPDPFVPDLVKALEENVGMSQETMLLRLDNALACFDEAAIFTIHGFCQRALADTPFAAGLPFKLELKRDDQLMRHEAASDFWRRQVASAAISPALADWLVDCKDSPDRWADLLMRQAGKPLSRLIWPPEDTLSDDDKQIDSASLHQAFEEAKKRWAGQGEAATTALINGMASLNANSYKLEGVQTGRDEWTEWLAQGNPLAALSNSLGKMHLFSAENLADKTKKGKTPPTHDFFDAAAVLLTCKQAFERALACARLRLLRQLFDEAGEQLRQKKRQQRQFCFDDILYNVHTALESGDTPWLAGSLRDRYPVALIDEFQDTDPLQFAIFDRIYGAVSAEGPVGPLFLVGDPKQAIYSFRNADLHTYLQARNKADALYTLRDNQRSVDGLIQACNALFGANSAAFILSGLNYQTVSLGAKPRKTLFDQSLAAPDAASLQIWRLPRDEAGGYLPRAEVKQWAVRVTAAEIVRLLREGQAGRIRLGERALLPGDMAILVKSHAQGRLMKEALRVAGVGCVELSQHSIFHTQDADDLERVLLAIVEPGRPTLIYAALATEILGFEAAAIAVLAAQEGALLAMLARFSAYRETWVSRGFGSMLRQLIEAEKVNYRFLTRQDGERRLTNLLHLGELLQQAASEFPAPEALLRWLTTQRREKGGDDVAQLRLESDRNLVQIVTIHKSKGLEYNIVFCPFLWDGYQSNFSSGEGREYHDDNAKPVIDFRPDAFFTNADELKEIKRRQREEQHAEFMRLMYVALTRAVHRCYLLAGCYSTLAFGKASETESKHSLLNWLVAGQGMPYADWLKNSLNTEDIELAWDALAKAAAPHISLRTPSDSPVTPLQIPDVSADSLNAAVLSKRIPFGWRLGSFSALQHGAVHEDAASDHDARIAKSLVRSPGAPLLVDEDILLFPRGPAAGECLHSLFENIDFTDQKTWPQGIEKALAMHPQSLPGLSATAAAVRLRKMLNGLLVNVLTCPLQGGIVLAKLSPQERLVELGFNLPAVGLTAQRLNDCLHKQGYSIPNMGFSPLNGYLKGFIDLIFRHEGRFYILDWKSNYLGNAADDYRQACLEQEMDEHGYHLQHLLYSVALQRYLWRRMPDYSYEQHFGGVHYLFVRGVRPNWPSCGAYFHRASQFTLDSLDALLETNPPGYRL